MKSSSMTGLLVLLAASCAHQVASPRLDSNASQVRVEGAKILATETGTPFSGTLIARGDEIRPVAKLVLGGTRLEAATLFDTSGLVLSLPVDAGTPSGRATLHLESGSKPNPLLARWGGVHAKAAAESKGPLKLAEAMLKDGRLDGRAVVFAPSSGSKPAIVAEASFRAGVPHGLMREYHVGSNQAKNEINFESGERSGPQRSFYADGSPRSESVYKDGLVDGVEIEYYKGGAKRAETTYRNGDRIKEVAWYPDGTMKRKLVDGPEGPRVTEWFSNGKLRKESGPDGESAEPPDGLIVEYHDNGAVLSRTNYVDGVRHGAHEAFYADGTKWRKATFKSGALEGPHKKWWKNGTPALDATAASGVLVGSFRRWYANGTLWEQATFVAGVRDGAYKKWWKNGVLAHDYTYKRGKLDGVYKTFYDSGAKWAVYTYRDGKPTGVHKRWFPDGTLGFEKHHKDGVPHGAFRRWWANGKPRLEANHVAGRLDGEFKNWLEDGTVYEQSTYKNGRKLKTVRNL